MNASVDKTISDCYVAAMEPMQLVPEGIPYMVYLPDGRTGLTWTKTADNDWAVAHIAPLNGGWRVKSVLNSAAGLAANAEVATAERITPDEAMRFATRRQTVNLRKVSNV